MIIKKHLNIINELLMDLWRLILEPQYIQKKFFLPRHK